MEVWRQNVPYDDSTPIWMQYNQYKGSYQQYDPSYWSGPKLIWPIQTQSSSSESVTHAWHLSRVTSECTWGCVGGGGGHGAFWFTEFPVPATVFCVIGVVHPLAMTDMFCRPQHHTDAMAFQARPLFSSKWPGWTCYIQHDGGDMCGTNTIRPLQCCYDLYECLCAQQYVRPVCTIFDSWWRFHAAFSARQQVGNSNDLSPRTCKWPAMHKNAYTNKHFRISDPQFWLSR